MINLSVRKNLLHVRRVLGVQTHSASEQLFLALGLVEKQMFFTGFVGDQFASPGYLETFFG
jgi:hypothetical protein